MSACQHVLRMRGPHGHLRDLLDWGPGEDSKFKLPLVGSDRRAGGGVGSQAASKGPPPAMAAHPSCVSFPLTPPPELALLPFPQSPPAPFPKLETRASSLAPPSCPSLSVRIQKLPLVHPLRHCSESEMLQRLSSWLAFLPSAQQFSWLPEGSV